MRYLLLTICLVLSTHSLHCQVMDSEDKKAIKFVEKADDQIKAREFDEAVQNLKKAIKKDPKFSSAYYKLANLYSFLRLIDSSYSYYQRYFFVVDKTKIGSKTALALSSRFFQRGDYDLARQAFDFAGIEESMSAKDSLLNLSIDYAMESLADPIELEIRPMDENINSFPLQYFPVMTIDRQKIFYTRRLGSGPQYDEDIVLSVRDGDVWAKPVSVSRNINSVYNEGACSVSADGNTMILTLCEGRKTIGNCDLFISRFVDDWSEPENMGREVNSPFWDSQPSLSADGKTLYFSSNRSGGFGKRDLWVTQFEEGSWTKPENLGPSINTPYDDTTPFIHFNSETLFFSSQGHTGMGGFDIYKTEEDAGSWSSPSNLGYPINDHENQIGLFISSDGTEGFYTRDENGRSIIYQMSLKSDSLVRRKTSYLTGTVRNSETNQPVLAQLFLYDLETQKRIYQTESNAVDGTYFVALNVDGDYGLFTQAPGFLFKDEAINLKSNFDVTPDTLDIGLQPIAVGNKLILNNIYFDFDSDELQPKSFAELEEIASFLKANNVIVEISGHTDSVGAKEYNKDLSKRRAKTVYEALIATGVAKESMSYIGYGDEKPVAIDKKNGKNQLNRRIEFKIIKKLSQ